MANETRAQPRVPHLDWRSDWAFRVCIDESYPLAVRMAGGEFLVAFSTGGEGPEEGEELATALAAELARLSLDVTVEAHSGYEVGRGASAEVILLVLGSPLLWTIKIMGEMALKEPEKLKENLRWWRQAWVSLRTSFEKLDVSELGDDVLKRVALAEFSADFPDRVPDVQRMTLVRHIGDVAESGWIAIDEATVLVPDADRPGHAIYVMDGLGRVRARVNTFPTEQAGDENVGECLESPPMLVSSLVRRDDPALDGADDERGHTPAVRVEEGDDADVSTSAPPGLLSVAPSNDSLPDPAQVPFKTHR